MQLAQSNAMQSEDLADKVVSQPDERFKNKKKVLFASGEDGKGGLTAN